MLEAAGTKSLADLLASEAERFEQSNSEPRRRERRYVRARPPEAPAQVYSVRIPVDRLEDLRRMAERGGMQPSSMLREWILERLEREKSRAADISPEEIGDVFARQVVLEIAQAAHDFAERGFGSMGEGPVAKSARPRPAKPKRRPGKPGAKAEKGSRTSAAG